MVDASDFGQGAVLMQEKGGERFPVAYYSKKFDKHQQNYSTIEKECLSMLNALKHFEVYLSSSKNSIRVFTDHNPLVFIENMKFKNRRLLAWSLTLQEFDITVSHVKGKDNIIADAFSRA